MAIARFLPTRELRVTSRTHLSIFPHKACGTFVYGMSLAEL
jgi:hypothetical protein